MNLEEDLRTYFGAGVLCCVATSAAGNQPHVVAAEIYASPDFETLLVLTTSGSRSARNVLQNPKVCVGIFNPASGRGLELQGLGALVERGDPRDLEIRPLFEAARGRLAASKSFIEVAILRIGRVDVPLGLERPFEGGLEGAPPPLRATP